MRLDQLKALVGDRVDIAYRSFMLRPQVEPRTMDAFTNYTRSWARPGEGEPAATFHQWSGEHEPPSHSVPALVAGKAAETFGSDISEAFHRRLLVAYFTENRTISDASVLLSLADDVGIERDAFSALLGEQRFIDAVVADHRAANDQGITAVPSVVVNGEYLLQGALEVAQYERVIETLGSR